MIDTDECNRLRAQVAALQVQVTVLEGLLGRLVVASDPPSMRAILRQVSQAYGVSVSEIVGPARAPRQVIARQEAMRIAHLAGYSNAFIGREMGGRHHSTVVHGRARAAERVAR